MYMHTYVRTYDMFVRTYFHMHVMYVRTYVHTYICTYVYTVHTYIHNMHTDCSICPHQFLMRVLDNLYLFGVEW